MITEQRIRNILESLTYKAAAGSTIAVEAIAVITELAKLRAEPPRTAAIWTREKPAEPGWYWLRGSLTGHPGAVVQVEIFGAPVDLAFSRNGHWFGDKDVAGAEWSGPIPEPAEPARAAEGEAK
jgi:hypothetical protein